MWIAYFFFKNTARWRFSVDSIYANKISSYCQSKIRTLALSFRLFESTILEIFDGIRTLDSRIIGEVKNPNEKSLSMFNLVPFWLEKISRTKLESNHHQLFSLPLFVGNSCCVVDGDDDDGDDVQASERLDTAASKQRSWNNFKKALNRVKNN